MPRFVLLEHDHPTLHWDLMLEVGEGLWTWRLAAPLPAGQVVAACRIADHRRVYLDYEGPVSGNRGTVRREDHGQFDWLEQTADGVVIQLHGQRAIGRLLLRHRAGDVWQAELSLSVSSLAQNDVAGLGG